MATIRQLLDTLDSQPAVRGRQFERICKWYLQHAPEYRTLLRRVWLWDEWPGRWGADSGIDLVAETQQGGLWAVQAKAYAADHDITKSDINSFLAESARDDFVFRLLMATTDFVGPTARRTIEAQTKPVGLCLLSHLSASGLDWPETAQSLHARHVSRAHPRPFQLAAVKDVESAFATHDKGQLRMACGTGKTLVGLWVAERLQSKRTLVLLPSLSLLAHTLRTWVINSQEPFAYLPVCSDDTVQEEDTFAAKTMDLGLPVTTDPEAIEQFLRRDERLVVFATYQSSPVLAEVFERFHPLSFDLAIADEAHRCAGTVPRAFSTILEPNRIRATHRLFMTATPRCFTPDIRQEAAESDLVIASMDDPGHFGPVFHTLSFSKAIEDGLLSDYQVAIVVVDNPTYRKYAQRGDFVTTDGKTITDARTLAGHIAVAKAMREYDLHKLISFHSRITRAADFSERLPEVIAWMPDSDRPADKVLARHVSGAMSTGRREAVLAEMRELTTGTRILVSNARCLGEGVDVPSLDGVVFIDPRRSQIEIIQALGRAIRKSPDKKMGTVVLPVFVDRDTDPKQALEGSAFRPIWDVLLALRAHDDALGETLDRLRQDLGRLRAPIVDIPRKIHIELPVSVDQGFSAAMRLKLVESTTASWDFYFGLFQGFIAENGHPIVPARYKTSDGYRLGAWATEQRVVYREGRILPERKERLEGIPGWEWSPHERRWEGAYEKLVEYVRRTGHARVEQEHICGDGFRLGRWVTGQRKRYHDRRLSSARRQALEALTGWTWNASRTWETGYNKFIEYSKTREATLIPRTYRTADGFALGNWVTHQRQEYRKGLLDPEIRQALEKIPEWRWNYDDAKWEVGLRQLTSFAQQQGHTRVPYDLVDRGFSLGAWVRSIRRQYANNRLSSERCNTLNTIPNWAWEWEGYHDEFTEWPDGLRRLEDYVRTHRHSCVPYEYKSPDAFPLGEWVRELRRRKRLGELPERHAKTLSALPGWAWNPRDIPWNKHYCALLEYSRRIGIKKLSTDATSDDGLAIGKWAEMQRQAHSRSALSPSRISLLEEIPEWFWPPLEPVAQTISHLDWTSCFSKLKAYVHTHSTAAVRLKYVDPDGFPLGRWVGMQRKACRLGALSDKQKTALASLHGWTWDPYDAKWQRAFRKLGAALSEQGSAALALSFVTDDGFPLGSWVQIQRRAYRKGRLDTSRVQALESLQKWTWTAPNASARDPVADWQDRIERLKLFVSQKRHARVPKMYRAPDGCRLGLWVASQRNAFRRGLLTSMQKEDLESLPGWSWGTSDDNWRDAFAKLQEFIKTNGAQALGVHAVTADNFRVGLWARAQRRAFLIGRLPTERLDLLKQVEGWPWQEKAKQRTHDAEFNAGQGVQSADDKWELRFEQLSDYVRHNGSARIARSYITPDGFGLGMWVGLQRKAFRRGRLSHSRRHRLEGLPGWEWDPYESTWNSAFMRLRDVLAAHEISDVKADYTTGDGVRLGLWIRTQQRAYRTGLLSKERQRLLESIAKWRWNIGPGPRRTPAWDEILVHVRRYSETHGNPNVPCEYVEEDGFPLGARLAHVRRKYKEKKLSQEQISALDSIQGWQWKALLPPNYVRVDDDRVWNEFLGYLREYVKKEGHALVPISFRTKNNRRLGYWVGGQRKAHRLGRLSEERTHILESLPGWSWSMVETWEAEYERARKLLDQIPIADIRQTHVTPDGFKLGRWINCQRMYRLRGSLSDEQIRKVEKIPGWVWNTLDDRWNKAYVRLVEFTRINGHPNIPQTYKAESDSFNLGQWVRIQKRYHRKGKLSEARIKALEKVKGWAW